MFPVCGIDWFGGGVGEKGDLARGWEVQSRRVSIAQRSDCARRIRFIVVEKEREFTRVIVWSPCEVTVFLVKVEGCLCCAIGKQTRGNDLAFFFPWREAQSRS